MAACTGSSPSWSCDSMADLETLVGGSAQDGDTITLEAGTYSATDVSIPNSKQLVITGEGDCPSTCNTIINGNSMAFRINKSASRITNLRFVYTANSESMQADDGGWRVDHCHFDYSAVTNGAVAFDLSHQNQYYPEYEWSGLIDNCKFENVRTVVNGAAYGLGVDAWEYHSIETGLGNDKAVYIEDCTFDHNEAFGNMLDTARSGVLVARFNTIEHYGGGAVIEGHGWQGTTIRATKRWEYYHNTITLDLSVARCFELRAGVGVLFNNTITGGGSNEHSVRFYHIRSTECDGTVTDYDQNTPGESGWLCRDQIGAGSDKVAFDGTLPAPEQNNEPSYVWGNTSNPAFYALSNDTTHVKENRDFYDSESADCDSNQSTGVCEGTWANRPTSCTDGVAYWATDKGGDWNTISGGANDGGLYVCAGGDYTDPTDLYYTPLTYPHPLRGQTKKAQYNFTGPASVGYN